MLINDNDTIQKAVALLGVEKNTPDRIGLGLEMLDNPSRILFKNSGVSMISVATALHESEKKYRSLVNNMQDTLYRSDCNGILTFMSPSGASLLGYDSVQEVIGKDLAETIYYNPKERTRFLKALKKKGKVTHHEVILKRKNGSPVIVSSNSRLMYDRNGAIQGVEGLFIDITERKHAEEMLRQSEEKFSKIFMMAPDVIVITQMDNGRIIDVNRGFEDISGWRRDEVVGGYSSDIKFWVDPLERDRIVKELKEGKEVISKECQFRHKDGSLRIGAYSARAINIAGDLCLIFVIQDVTDRRRMEEERHRIEQDLYHSEKKAAIGQLAGGLAHDFNNILMGIQANTSLMQLELTPDGPLSQRLRRIEEHIKRGADLTKQLVKLVRETKYDVKTSSEGTGVINLSGREI